MDGQERLAVDVVFLVSDAGALNVPVVMAVHL